METYFTEEEINLLRQFEVHFNTVIKYSYKRNTTTKQNETVVSIYENRTKKKLPHTFSCSVCVFNIFKTVGELYFKSIEHNNKKALREANKKKVEQSTTQKKKTQQRAKKQAKQKE